MKKLIFVLPAIFIYSCSPSSSGQIWQDDKGCTILTNQSTSEKITFTLQFPLKSTNKDSVGYMYKQQITLGPQTDSYLGCSDDAKTYEIVGGYVNSN